jgi:hypothetical protein
MAIVWTNPSKPLKYPVFSKDIPSSTNTTNEHILFKNMYENVFSFTFLSYEKV